MLHRHAAPRLGPLHRDAPHDEHPGGDGDEHQGRLRAQAQTHPDFAKNFQRILPELRYGEPGYNTYVYRPGDHQSRLPQLREKMEKVRGFQQKLEGIAANENPFEGLALYGREGIAVSALVHASSSASGRSCTPS
jgi:hypothetical protein